jgi:hypothetical protein
MSKSRKDTEKSAKRIVLIVFSIVLVVLVFTSVAGYLALKYLSSPILTNQQEAVVELSSDIASYPDAYLSANLPQYPDAELISLSKKTDTAEQGINLIINTKDDSATIARYFDERLLSSGWVAITSNTDYQEVPYIRDYKKDNQTFSILINPLTDKEYKNTVSITWKSTQ